MASNNQADQPAEKKYAEVLISCASKDIELDSPFRVDSILKSISKRVDMSLCMKSYGEALKWQKEHMDLCDEVFSRTDGKYLGADECSLSRAKYVSILLDMGRYDEALDYSIDALNYDESDYNSECKVYGLLPTQFAICCLKLGMTEDEVEKLIKDRLVYASSLFPNKDEYMKELMEHFAYEKKYLESTASEQARPSLRGYDVFISYKSEDESLAKEVYDYLTEMDKKVFYSKETLPQLGRSEYEKTIFEAIDRSRHMVLIASDPEYLKTAWVQDEWSTFNNEIREGRKTGNLVLLLTDDISAEKGRLPAQLRQKEIVRMSELKSRLLSYLR